MAKIEVGTREAVILHTLAEMAGVSVAQILEWFVEEHVDEFTESLEEAIATERLG